MVFRPKCGSIRPFEFRLESGDNTRLFYLGLEFLVRGRVDIEIYYVLGQQCFPVFIPEHFDHRLVGVQKASVGRSAILADGHVFKQRPIFPLRFSQRLFSQFALGYVLVHTIVPDNATLFIPIDMDDNRDIADAAV